MNYSETIDGCKKLIESKVIDVNILFSGNMVLLESIFRMIGVPYVWCWIVAIFYTKIWCNFKTFILTLIIFTALFIIGKILKSWIKFAFKESYNNIKVNVVRNIVENCKELKELDCPNWQKRQLMKDMANLGGVDIIWDNNK